ncbi:TLDc domain-containing protein [Entamoeba marina]
MDILSNNQLFVQFNNVIPQLMLTTDEAMEYANIDVEMKRELKKFEVDLQGDDKEDILKYEEMYKQLHESIVQTDKAVLKGSESINQLTQLVEKIQTIHNKEADDSNEMKATINNLVDRIICREEDIFREDVEKSPTEFEKRKAEFEKRKAELITMKVIQTKPSKRKFTPIVPKVFNGDEELLKLNRSMDTLKNWCGGVNCNILFDSKVDGNGKRTLSKKVLNHSNVCFISFDEEGNMFGGRVKEEITKTDAKIIDPNAFVFTLFRDGEEKQQKFDIKKGNEEFAFYLFRKNDCLYYFGAGSDVNVYKVGSKESWCSQFRYDYNGIKKAITTKQGSAEAFTISRIIAVSFD